MVADSQFLRVGATFEVLAHLAVFGLLLARSYRRQLEDRYDWLVLGLLHLVTAAGAVGFAPTSPSAWGIPAASALLIAVLCRLHPNDRPVRSAAIVNVILSSVVSVVALYQGIVGVALDSLGAWLSAVIASLSLVMVALGFLVEVFQDSVQVYPLYRKSYLRPTTALPPRCERFPKVSIHVPCYCEPTDVLIETLNALSKLHYPNYEVLVIDNNTQDPGLWRPVQDHCAELGPVFRFFHVDPLAGAKGGALNFALRESAPDAEIIASIDADYISRPEFLEELVGFFDDPDVGYVQTPHDYRDWEGSAFLRGAYWQYAPHFYLRLPGRNEWDASQIAGTMCLVRRTALEKVGGWSETCLTEDSELAVRLHAHGFTGQYLNKSYGKGLIPETFAEYQRQRFRWTAGPVQEMKMYWRMLLPRPFAKPSKLTPAQKTVIFANGLEYAGTLVEHLLLLVAACSATLLTARGEVAHLPGPVVAMTATAILSSWGMALVRSRLIGRSFADSVRAGVAHLSLHYVRTLAVLATLVSNRPLAWHRTSKFKATSAGWTAMRSSARPTAMGLAALALGGWLITRAQWGSPDVVLLAGAGLLYSAIRWLCAPYLTWLSEHELRSAEKLAAPAVRKPVVISVGGPIEPYLGPAIHGIGRLAVGPMYAWAPHALSDRKRENPTCPIEVTRSRE